MITVALYDAKPYDREYFDRALGHERIAWQFHEFRLSVQTAATADGMRVVCIFVNDHVDRACISGFAKDGVKLIALHCAGFNNVDLKADQEFGIAGLEYRVPIACRPDALIQGKKTP